MPITHEVLDQILKDYEKPEDLLSENGLLPAVNQSTCRASFKRRADASSRLRKSTILPVTIPAIRETVQRRKFSKANADRSRSKCRVTGTASSSRSWSRRIRSVSTVWTKRSFRFTPRDDAKRDQRSSGRDLRRRYFTFADFQRHRFGARRSSGVAVARTRSGLPDSVSRCAESKSQKSGQSRQQSQFIWRSV